MALPAHLKDYVEVKDRLPTFLKQFPEGCVTCEIIGDPDKVFERTPNAVIVKASLTSQSLSVPPASVPIAVVAVLSVIIISLPSVVFFNKAPINPSTGHA